MAQKTKPGKESSKEVSLPVLERQVERGSLFTHTALSRNSERIHEAESFLYGLIDVLVEKEALSADEISQASARVRLEMDEKGDTLGPGLALRVDGDNQDFTPVNCSERIHICKAICCKLHFALTPAEVESGKVKWDLGQPYYIRQEATGCCSHLDTEKKCCSIYKDRPGICRSYSCANDERIWKDFDKMELNQEWLDGHLKASRPRLAAALMHKPAEIKHGTPPSDQEPGSRRNE